MNEVIHTSQYLNNPICGIPVIEKFYYSSANWSLDQSKWCYYCSRYREMLLFFIVVDDIHPNYWDDGSTTKEFCRWLNEAAEEEGINKLLESWAKLAAIRLLSWPELAAIRLLSWPELAAIWLLWNIHASKWHINTFFQTHKNKVDRNTTLLKIV